MSDELLVNWTHFLSNISRGLIQFNLGSLPGSATITGATLTLVQTINDGYGKAYSLYRNTDAWDEATVTYNTRPAFDAPTVSTLAINDHTISPRSWDVTNVVQGWYSGAYANDGLTLIQTPELAEDYTFFFSSKAFYLIDRPVLTVTYTTPVPEPGSIALLAGMGAAGAAFLRRRKQAVRNAI